MKIINLELKNKFVDFKFKYLPYKIDISIYKCTRNGRNLNALLCCATDARIAFGFKSRLRRLKVKHNRDYFIRQCILNYYCLVLIWFDYTFRLMTSYHFFDFVQGLTRCYNNCKIAFATDHKEVALTSARFCARRRFSPISRIREMHLVR